MFVTVLAKRLSRLCWTCVTGGEESFLRTMTGRHKSLKKHTPLYLQGSMLDYPGKQRKHNSDTVSCCLHRSTADCCFNRTTTESLQPCHSPLSPHIYSLSPGIPLRVCGHVCFDERAEHMTGEQLWWLGWCGGKCSGWRTAASEQDPSGLKTRNMLFNSIKNSELEQDGNLAKHLTCPCRVTWLTLQIGSSL